MTEPIRIDEIDWTELEGKTLNVTLQVMGDRAYLIEGQQVHVVDLAAGKVQEELPFFGPRSSRTGRLTDEQQHALDLLIDSGYTIHRAAMLLGISDSTVSTRKKQLRAAAPPPVKDPPRPPRVLTGPQARLRPDELAQIKYLFFVAGEHPADIGIRLGHATSTINRYIKRMDDGEFEEIAAIPPSGYPPTIGGEFRIPELDTWPDGAPAPETPHSNGTLVTSGASDT